MLYVLVVLSSAVTVIANLFSPSTSDAFLTFPETVALDDSATPFNVIASTLFSTSIV